MTRTSDPSQLALLAKEVRRDIVKMTGAAKSGHPGGSLSAVEILVTLYWDVMKHDPAHPKAPGRDRFILSKGHAAPVLYSVMAEAGYTPKDQLNTLRQLGSIYQGHPDLRFIPSLEASTGSLGQGLSLALGIGCANKLSGLDSRVYVMLGDGEIQEGQIWEAAMFGACQKVDNVCAIVDYNKIQLDGFVKDIMELEPLKPKWEAFGWNTLVIDGHDIPQIQAAFANFKATKGKPTCIIANTVKGKGVSFMENKLLWHYRSPSDEQLAAALRELGDAP
jgi:transketolase